MNTGRFFGSLWANRYVLLVLIAVYALMISTSYALRSERPKVPPIDVVFVFDSTGSMGDKIRALLRTSSRFASILASSGSDYRLAMVTFGAAEESSVIRETFPPSGDLAGFQSFLRGISDGGGGREDQLTAINFVLSQFTYRPDAKKILILVTDEALYGDESSGDPLPLDEWNTMIQNVQSMQFTAYSVSHAHEPFQSLTARTGGKFYDISRQRDFTDILIGIAEDINASITR